MTSEDELQARLAQVAALTTESRQVLLGCLVGVVAANQWVLAVETAQKVERDFVAARA